MPVFVYCIPTYIFLNMTKRIKNIHVTICVYLKKILSRYLRQVDTNQIRNVKINKSLTEFILYKYFTKLKTLKYNIKILILQSVQRKYILISSAVTFAYLDFCFYFEVLMLSNYSNCWHNFYILEYFSFKADEISFCFNFLIYKIVYFHWTLQIIFKTKGQKRISDF